MGTEQFDYMRYTEVGRKTGDYLQVGNFENLSLPEVLPKYTGEGETSYSFKYDNGKREFLEGVGIDIPESFLGDNGEIKERALFVTMFIVTGHILVSESIKRELGEYGGDTFKKILQERNAQLEDARVDEYNYRRVLPDGSRVEDHFKNLGFSANPQKRVSRAELEGIVSYVFRSLAKSK